MNIIKTIKYIIESSFSLYFFYIGVKLMQKPNELYILSLLPLLIAILLFSPLELYFQKSFNIKINNGLKYLLILLFIFLFFIYGFIFLDWKIILK